MKSTRVAAKARTFIVRSAVTSASESHKLACYSFSRRFTSTMASSNSKVWFVTGASSGFGRAVTEVMLQKGDNVVATLRKPAMLDDLTKLYPKNRLLTLPLDVTVPGDITTAFVKAREAFGRIDVVFNNAGLAIVSEAEGMPDDDAKLLFDTLFWGAANVTKEAVTTFRDFNRPPGGRLLQVYLVQPCELFPEQRTTPQLKQLLNLFLKGMPLSWIQRGILRSLFFNLLVSVLPHPGPMFSCQSILRTLIQIYLPDNIAAYIQEPSVFQTETSTSLHCKCIGSRN